MKKILVSLTILTVFIVGAIAYAGPGFGGKGHMSSYGYGNHMNGPNYGWHMMGRNMVYDQKFLDGTTDLRKGPQNKRFMYQEKLYDKTPILLNK
jgi:hypothetical protein